MGLFTPEKNEQAKPKHGIAFTAVLVGGLFALAGLISVIVQ